MVAWCCAVLFPLAGIVCLGAGVALFYASYDQIFVDQVKWLIIAGSVLFGLAVLNFLLSKLFISKAKVTKKSAGFPDQRNPVFRVVVLIYSVITTVFIAWPLGYFVQLFLRFTIGWFLSEKQRLWLNGRVLYFSSAMFSIFLSPFWNIKVVRWPEGGLPEGSIIMPNHLTFSDGFIMSTAMFPYDSKFVATSWVFNIPFGGWLAKHAGFLPIKFIRVNPEEYNGKRHITDKEVVKNTMERAGEYLRMGLRMTVFPEGSLSKDGELLEFKDGFFRLAIDYEATIVPVGLWGSQTLWLHGANLPQPGYAEAAFGEPIKVSSSDDLETLKNQVKQEVKHLRNSLPLYRQTIGRRLTTIGKTSTWATMVPENFL